MQIKRVFLFFFHLNLSLTLFSQIGIVKGPYLQVGTQNSIIIKWETTVACDSKVTYGTNSSSLSGTVTDNSNVTSHEIQITGLSPYTKYFYSIGATNTYIQGDTNNYFVTSPLPGAVGNYRFWVTGDCGNASTNQMNCKNQYLNYNAGKRTDGWILLGDNAYFFGSDAEYNAEFFNIYQGDIMKKAVLWPAPGNHDYVNGTITTTAAPYYTIFTTPDNAQAGGFASGTKAYYSFDYGNIHFISLDSYGTRGASQKMYDTLGPQAVWLKNDLALNNKRWTIAYWHHPPYTMGSHNSDIEADLVSIRQDFIRILERYHVDLIMCGHSHDYERSKLMKGHYGPESTFNAAQQHLSSSSGVDDGTSNSCPYTKDSLNNRAGTVYVVAGSAGQLGGQQAAFPHDAMYYSDATNGGSLVLDINDNKLECKWLCADGQIRDKFTIYKDVGRVSTYTVQPGQILNLKASWPTPTFWNNGLTSSSVNVSGSNDTLFWVNDAHNCIADTFKLKVLPAADFSLTGGFCAGQTWQLTDLSSNAPLTWFWTINPGAGVSLTSSVSQNPVLNISNAAVYTISLVSGNMYGLSAMHSETLLVYPNPAVSFSNSDTLICEGETAHLMAQGSSNYLWSTGQTDSVIAVSPLQTTVYTATFATTAGCSSVGSVTLIVELCEGLSGQPGTQKISLFPNPSPGELIIQMSDPAGCFFSLQNSWGISLIGEQELTSKEEKISLGLIPGIYFYQIKRGSEILKRAKLIIK